MESLRKGCTHPSGQLGHLPLQPALPVEAMMGRTTQATGEGAFVFQLNILQASDGFNKDHK